MKNHKNEHPPLKSKTKQNKTSKQEKTLHKAKHKKPPENFKQLITKSSCLYLLAAVFCCQVPSLLVHNIQY